MAVLSWIHKILQRLAAKLYLGVIHRCRQLDSAAMALNTVAVLVPTQHLLSSELGKLALQQSALIYQAAVSQK